MKNESDRLLSLKALTSLLSEQGSLSSILEDLARKQPEANLSLIRELVYGVCRWYYRLDFFMSRLLEKPLRTKDRDIHLLVMLGLYQLLHMRIPDHAAINETVALTRALKKPWARGLVNALLRRAQRERDSLEAAIKKDEFARVSFPAWLAEQIQQDWGDDANPIMDASNIQAPMTLRVNTTRNSRDDYLKTLEMAGIQATAGHSARSAIVLETPCDTKTLPGFSDGMVSVQDEASQLSAQILAPEPGSRVLDVCAAPGGKTCALLEEAAGNLAMTALDSSERRLTKVHENLARLGLNANVICADGTDTQSWWDGKQFNAILLDAPCSGTGVIRRHPDIKLLRKKGDISRLVDIQYQLLMAMWPILASGGKLLYSTCSLLKVENEEQISRFINEKPDASLLPLALPGAGSCTAGIQFFPVAGGFDGFYYALLQKA